MRRINIKSILDSISDQASQFQGLGLVLFLVCFVCQGINIYDLKQESLVILNAIETETISINESNQELIVKANSVSKYSNRLKENLEKSKPFFRLFDGFQIENGDLSSFLNQIWIDANGESLYGFRQGPAYKKNSIYHNASSYPELKAYGLSKAYQEFVLRACSYNFYSKGLYKYKAFTSLEKVNNQYHFHPNNFDVTDHNTHTIINGEIMTKEDYFWRPTRRGMHYFDIEYIDINGLEFSKKQFRIGLKVV